jgi:hypothetical protein
MMTAGGVRLDHDQSRSLLHVEQEETKSVYSDHKELEDGMKYMYTLAASFRLDVDEIVEKIKQGFQP